MLPVPHVLLNLIHLMLIMFQHLQYVLNQFLYLNQNHHNFVVVYQYQLELLHVELVQFHFQHDLIMDLQHLFSMFHSRLTTS